MQTVIEINASAVNNKCLNRQTGEASRALHPKTWCYCCVVIAALITIIKCEEPDAIISWMDIVGGCLAYQTHQMFSLTGNCSLSATQIVFWGDYD